MNPRLWSRIGWIGAVVTAICCFTPVLVIALSGLGFAAVVGGLNLVLFPLLGFFLAMLAAGWVLSRRRAVAAAESSDTPGD